MERARPVVDEGVQVLATKTKISQTYHDIVSLMPLSQHKKNINILLKRLLNALRSTQEEQKYFSKPSP